MDDAFIHGYAIEFEYEFKRETNASVDMTILVMFDTLCESDWPYPVRARGMILDSWLPGKIANHLATVGVVNTRTVIKTDTAPAIVKL